MCFAPQRRVIFRHLNFQKWPGTVSLLHFDLQMCFAPQRRAIFFICPLATWLCTSRFSEPTFRSSGTTNHWKITTVRDFPNISRDCIFFLLTFFSGSRYFLTFHLSRLSEVRLLNFLRTTKYYKIRLRTTKYYAILQITTPHYKVVLRILT